MLYYFFQTLEHCGTERSAEYGRRGGLNKFFVDLKLLSFHFMNSFFIFSNPISLFFPRNPIIPEVENVTPSIKNIVSYNAQDISNPGRHPLPQVYPMKPLMMKYQEAAMLRLI